MSADIKTRIAVHFSVGKDDLEYRSGARGRGWYYKGRFLHTSLYEMQHCPAWKLKDITNYYIGDRKEKA
ncbi:MAG: hypothetical protein GTN64_07435 [Candidatus Latescibacteria bacterium]|nr:hypothetical protein [Candidatus Latescibacterota bacterium]NIO78435.1 hypothetical protein [Candidatus Latescibacterota bacterium]